MAKMDSKQNKQSLTKNELQDIIDFSRGLYMAENMGFYTPWMSNQVIQDINNNPRIPSFEKIQEALANYKDREKDLQGYTEFMNQNDMIFKRTLYSYVNTLAFDLEVTCTNAYTKSDYKSKEYKEDKKRVYDFLDKFNYKKEFKEASMEVLLHETDFVWYRKTKWNNKGMKYALQTMPQDYCLLTAKWSKGWLWDFDFSYFLKPGTDVMGYDPSIIKTYKDIMENPAHPKNYRPTVPLNKRTGQFAYWGQTSPNFGAWVFKLSNNNANQTPFLAPFLKNTFRSSEIEKLQYNKDMISAYGILAGAIRLIDNAKSGAVANQFAIDPTVLGGFMSKAKAGLGDAVKLAALPIEDPDFYQFNDANPNMYDTQLSSSAGIGSGVGRLIYSSDRMSNAEIEAGIINQYNTMKPLYYQFEEFLNFFVNDITKKYKFAFRFSGCDYPFEREKRFDRLCKMADKGIVLGPSAWAAASGYRPQEFERLMADAKYGEFADKLMLLLNANTTAMTNEDKNGRPTSDTSDLTDSGEASRDSEGNL